MTTTNMNSEPLPGEGARIHPIAGATLQAVLQLADGTMDSIAVPVPLPEAIVRLKQSMPPAEVHFRRARSADSVVRYVEEVAVLADGGSAAHDAPARRCARCGAASPMYYVPKLTPNEPVTPATAACCESCYPSAAA